MPDPGTPLLRRTLLKGSGGLALALIASACKQAEPSSCTSTANLSSKEIEPRSALNYSDRSLDPAKTCDKCVQYVESPGPAQCGGCKIMKGPIHPKGTCNVFAPKA